jgi:hypothetical protein
MHIHFRLVGSLAGLLAGYQRTDHVRLTCCSRAIHVVGTRPAHVESPPPPLSSSSNSKPEISFSNNLQNGYIAKSTYSSHTDTSNNAAPNSTSRARRRSTRSSTSITLDISNHIFRSVYGPTATRVPAEPVGA